MKKKIEKISLTFGLDEREINETAFSDHVATGEGLLKVMEKINELIDYLNELGNKPDFNK